MEARILVIGDPHIKSSNLIESIDLMEKIINIVNEIDSDLVIFMGDILHQFDLIKSQPQSETVDYFYKLSLIKPLMILIGNHDLPGPTSYFSKHHGFRAVKYWEGTKSDNVIFPNGKGVEVVDTECIIFYIKGIKFCAVPYLPDGRFQEGLNTNKDYDNNVRAIFAHQQFIGCKMGEIYSKNGDNWNLKNPLVISGHIHQYQNLKNNVTYVGTPRQSSFNDSIDKTISLFSFSKDEIKEKRISIGIPQKIHLKTLSSEIETLIIPTNGNIKITIIGTFDENRAVKKHPIIKEWKKREIFIVYNDINKETLKQEYFVYDESKAPSFALLLYEEMKLNPLHKILYHELFDNLHL